MTATAEALWVGRWLVFDIGCIECGEPSNVVAFCGSEAEAEIKRQEAKDKQAADWHGQHHFEVFDLAALG